MKNALDNEPDAGLRRTLYKVIFDADTKSGKAFDILLIIAIVLSVAVVMLDSIESVREHYSREFLITEWTFTILFSIEYLLRIISARKALKYMLSFYGIVDLLAVLPTYLSLILPGTQYLLAIRVLRILRIFRVLKLVKYLDEATFLTNALKQSRRKIAVFLFAVIMLAIFAGSLIYVVEGKENGFTSIPLSIYWAIVTLSTVGFGDLAPVTSLGKFIAAVIMVLGYGIIAVPTGIVSYEMGRTSNDKKQCSECGTGIITSEASYCHNCGNELLGGSS